jgi:hypothetical protein
LGKAASWSSPICMGPIPHARQGILLVRALKAGRQPILPRTRLDQDMAYRQWLLESKEGGARMDPGYHPHDEWPPSSPHHTFVRDSGSHPVTPPKTNLGLLRTGSKGLISPLQEGLRHQLDKCIQLICGLFG